jgi:hypothetical protein
VQPIPEAPKNVVLWDGGQWVRLLKDGVGTRAAMPFFSAADATRYLRAMPAQGSISHALRHLLCWCDGSLAVSRLSHEEVISLVAERLATGRLILTASSGVLVPRPGLRSTMKGGSINERKLAEALQAAKGMPASPTSTPAPRDAPSQQEGVPTYHWRDVLGAEAEAVIAAVSSRTRGTTEALGELGMEVAKRLLGIQSDPRFIKRYHGRDDLCRDEKGQMVGIEAKGSQTRSTALSMNDDDIAQLSREANRKTAGTMLTKARQRGNAMYKSSSRQGGAYTPAEIELYRDIDSRDGAKRLLSTHTQVTTGYTQVLERDSMGKPTSGKPLTEFMMGGLDEAQALLAKRGGQ